MCLNIFNNNTTQQEDIERPISSSTQLTILKGGYGQTIRYKTNASTFWTHVLITYNPVSKIVDGYGYSIFQRKKIPFLIVGKEIPTLNQNNNNVVIKVYINKFHLSEEINNIVGYTGFISLQKKKIDLISEKASGEINFY